MSSAKWMLAATALGLVTWCFAAASVLPGFPADAMRIRFLVTVNDTWDTDGCIATVATPFLLADKLYNETEPITVGRCDKGPLDFHVQHGGSPDGYSSMSVVVTFHSSVIEDASPPQCSIAWNGTYVQPTEDQMDLSPLPSCFTMESREGYHMTAYWFRLMEWHFQ